MYRQINCFHSVGQHLISSTYGTAFPFTTELAHSSRENGENIRMVSSDCHIVCSSSPKSVKQLKTTDVFFNVLYGAEVRFLTPSVLIFYTYTQTEWFLSPFGYYSPLQQVIGSGFGLWLVTSEDYNL